MYILYMYVFESLYICTYHVHVHTVQSLKINIVKTSSTLKWAGIDGIRPHYRLHCRQFTAS